MGSIHTKIVTEGSATMYRRVDERTGMSFTALDDLAYIIVDHQMREVVCGSTEEGARRSLFRARRAARER